MQPSTALFKCTAFTVFLSGAAAAAGPSPFGVWIDDTGRAAIEITDCGGKLCGRLVWFRDAAENKNCGKQLIGDVAPLGGGKWDRGWVYSPEKKQKFDVEITPLSASRLQVMGYAGLKFLSKTMVWTRAPATLARCDKTNIESAAPSPGTQPNTLRDTAKTSGAGREGLAANRETPAASGRTGSPAPASSRPAVAAAPPSEPPVKKPPPGSAAAAPSAAAPSPAARTETPETERPGTGGVEREPRRTETARAETVPEDDAGPSANDTGTAPGRREEDAEDTPGNGGKGTCTLKVPYVTITFPCDK